MDRAPPLIARHPLRARVIAEGSLLDQRATASDDLRFFLMAWLGGLVFFATYLA